MVLEAITSMIKDIESYLLDQVEKNSPLFSSSYYADSFFLSYSLMDPSNENFFQEKVLQSFLKKDRSKGDYHFEFHHYAFSHIPEEKRPLWVQEFLTQERFKNTPCCNWSLMRALVCIKEKKDLDSKEKVKLLLKKFQTKDGCICDEKQVYSLQYHSFSLALLGEIYLETQDPFFKKSFKKGFYFIRSFILDNGDTLYLGRGQEQIFGYASLIYLLILTLKIDSHLFSLTLLEKVLNYLSLFKKDNGSYPLVLRKQENIDFSKEPNLLSKGYLGWYGYNRYGDYIVFLLFFLFKGLSILKKQTQYLGKKESLSKKNGQELLDKQFLLFKNSSYEAVVAAPKGRVSNGLALPYIVSNKTHQTPCYGGENFAPSLYQKKDQPLFYFPDIRKTLAVKCYSKILKNTLYMLSPLGFATYSYHFFQTSLKVDISLLSPFKSVFQLPVLKELKQIDPLTFESNYLRIQSSESAVFDRIAFSCREEFDIYFINSKTISLTFECLC